MQTNQSKPTKKKQPDDKMATMRYASMATQMMVIIGLGVIGGYKLDQYLGWDKPIATLVLSLFSVGLAIYLSIKDFLKK